MDRGFKTRLEILSYALSLEEITSTFLSFLLGIKNQKDSYIFSNSNTSLSFKNKIELLIDIGALEGDTKKKFITFMEIRNQFMHNNDASNYVRCYSYLIGKEKFILKHYPQSANSSKETQLRRATIALADDILEISIKLFDKVKAKIKHDAELENLKKSNKALVESIVEALKILNEQLDLLKTEENSISLVELKKYQESIFPTIYKIWSKKMEI